MKSLIFYKTTRTSKIERTAIYLLGVCIFISERDVEPDETSNRRPCGFVQYADIEEDDDELEEDDGDDNDTSVWHKFRNKINRR